MRLRPGTGQGDIEIKAKHAREFLAEGHKVAILLQFRGREMSHKEIGIEQIRKFATMLADIAKMEQEPRIVSYAHPFYWAPFVLIGNFQ